MSTKQRSSDETSENLYGMRIRDSYVEVYGYQRYCLKLGTNSVHVLGYSGAYTNKFGNLVCHYMKGINE